MPTLTRDFRADYAALIAGILPGYYGPPYAFVRFADGEGAIMFGQQHAARSDLWAWSEGDSRKRRHRQLVDGLHAAISYVDPSPTFNAARQRVPPGWHVGITAGEHHPEWHRRLLPLAKVPIERISFAEIFGFGNYNKFVHLDWCECFTVGGRIEKHDLQVPKRPNDPAWPKMIGDVVKELGKVRKPILVAAGPWAKVLILKYWQETPPDDRQVILDVGSALRLTHRRTRAYHGRRSELRRWEPRWECQPE